MLSENAAATLDAESVTCMQMIDEHWVQLAAAAWHNYIRLGRGLVVLLPRDDTWSLGYMVGQTASQNHDWRDSELLQCIQTYVPEQEALVLVCGDSDHIFHIHHSLAPPAAYQLRYHITLCHAA
jgi:hypothetical protein